MYIGTYTLRGVWSTGNYGNRLLYLPLPVPLGLVSKYNISISNVTVGFHNTQSINVNSSNSLSAGMIQIVMNTAESVDIRDYPHQGSATVVVSLK